MYENDNNEEEDDDIDIQAIRKRRLRYKKLKKMKKQKLASSINPDSKTTPSSAHVAVVTEESTQDKTNNQESSVLNITAPSTSNPVETHEKTDVKGKKYFLINRKTV